MIDEFGYCKLGDFGLSWQVEEMSDGKEASTLKENENVK